MALINCKECGKEVSDKAKKCPNCGYRIKKGGCIPMILIWISLMVFLVYYVKESYGTSGGIITDTDTYSNSWRSPQGDEYLKIGKIIVRNDIKVCGEYQVKEIMKNEFVIACTADGKNWNYFVVYPNLDKIFAANDEMIRKLSPPR